MVTPPEVPRRLADAVFIVTSIPETPKHSWRQQPGVAYPEEKRAAFLALFHAVLDGDADAVREALREAMPATDYRYDYRLLDPDIFGDELEKEPYAGVDRIAAIGLCVQRDAAAHE